MSKTVLYMDQTVNEALRRQCSARNISRMLETLLELKVAAIDVSVASWEKLKESQEAIAIPCYRVLRGRIKASLAEFRHAYHLGFETIIIVYQHLSRKHARKKLYPVLAAASLVHTKIIVHIENAAQLAALDIDYYLRLFVKFDVKSFIYGDKDSILEPFTVYQAMQQLKPIMPCSLEFHGHNRYGLATANALAACRAGVRHIAVAVAGVGSSGHAALEEVMLAIRHILKLPVPPTDTLASTSAYLLACMGLSLPGTKAIIGANVFAHESGIHVDGIMKQPALYEAFLPEEVGLVRRLVIGKHSGQASIRAKCQELGRPAVAEALLPRILQQIRRTSVQKKRALTHAEFMAIVDDVAVPGE